MSRVTVLLAALLLAACTDDRAASVVETVEPAPLRLSVRAAGELKSSKATALTVPGSQWAERQLAWMLPEGSHVRKGELIARFTAEHGRLDLAQATVDLERNALARVAKERELDTGRGRVEVDLAQVGVELSIANRYAGADLGTMARNEVLDAVQDVRYLGTKQDTLQWKRGQFARRGGAELAVLDAQRATYAINARRRQDDLDALELRAPHDGVLMLTANWSGDKPAIGSALRAGFDFGSLPDASSLEVELSLPQSEAQGIKVGDAVELSPIGRPAESVTTTLSWVASGAKVRSRQSPVKYVSMKAPLPADAARRLGLVPGQRMRADIVLLHSERTLSVPNVALDMQDGRSFVQVRSARGFERREVRLGVRGPARSQVLDGLQAGETVLLLPGDGGDGDGDGASPEAAGAAPAQEART